MPREAGRSVKDSMLKTTYKVPDGDLNQHGTLYGGRAVAIIDGLAARVARTHAGMDCVTASMDSIHFLSPVYVDETLDIRISINRSWRTSMEIGIKILVRRKQKRIHVASAYFTFVAINHEGRPAEIPSLIPQTRNERRRFRQAEERRQIRLANRPS